MKTSTILRASIALVLLLWGMPREADAQVQRTLRAGSAERWQPTSNLPRPSRTRIAPLSPASGEEVVAAAADTSILQESVKSGSAAVEEIAPGEVVEEDVQEIVDGIDEAVYEGETIVHDGDVIYEDGTHLHEGEYIVGGEPYCEDCHSPGRWCICLPAHGWVQTDVLMWFQNGMNTPPLVTTSPTGTTQANAGVLPNAKTLFGGSDLLNDQLTGGRIRFGWWLSKLPGWGIEGEYFSTGTVTDSYLDQSAGTPILARPFFNSSTNLEDAELVAFPNVVTGAINAEADSQLTGAAFRLRRCLFSGQGFGRRWWDCASVPTASRFDGTIGYRYYQLNENLTINERLVSNRPNEPGTFNITDAFGTRNLFNGVDLGMQWQGRKGYWSLDLLMRLGLGNSHQTVTIKGNTIISQNNVTTNNVGGLLAQRTNIGTFDRDRFSVVPELGATIGYQLTRRLRLNVGYSFIYWSSVVRPGDQISTDVNPNLMPPEQVPLTGPLRPQFRFTESDYWVQGINLGAEYRW